MNNLLKQVEQTLLEQDHMKKELPVFNVGDTVKVMVKVIEGDKERTQGFEGIVIAKKGGGIRESFTVRRISFGIGVERVFPLHSPRISKVEVIRKGKVRRAKLYYIRALSGKAAKIKEVATVSTKKVTKPASTPVAPSPVAAAPDKKAVKATKVAKVEKAPKAEKKEKAKK